MGLDKVGVELVCIGKFKSAGIQQLLRTDMSVRASQDAFSILRIALIICKCLHPVHISLAVSTLAFLNLRGEEV